MGLVLMFGTLYKRSGKGGFKGGLHPESTKVR